MSDMATKFLEYASRFNPEFPGKVKGATEAQIAQFQELAGRKFPESYLSFLRHLGADDGGLKIALEASTSITRLIRFYTNEVSTGALKPPPDSIIIAVGGLSIEEFALQFRGGLEPCVVFSESEDVIGDCAESLEKLLYQTAFGRYEMSVLPHRESISGPPAEYGARNLLGITRDVAVDFGMTIRDFSDKHNLAAARSDAMLAANDFGKLGSGVILASASQVHLGRMARIFAAKLGFERQATSA